MATWKFRGLDTYIAQLEKLSDHAVGQMKMAVWEGGKVVADNMKAAIESLPVQDEFVPRNKKRTGITSEEKAELISGFGLSKMRTGGSVTTKAGFDGASAGTARKVTSGTTWMKKNSAIRQAVTRSKAQAEEAIRVKLESEIEKLMK